MKNQIHFEPGMAVRYAPGVGPKISEKLGKLGLQTIEDLLHYYPRTWEDRRALHPLKDARVDQEMSFFGKIVEVGFHETARGFAIVKALIEDDTGSLLCKWMRRRSYQYDVLKTFRTELKEGVSILAYGKVVFDFEGKSLNVEEHEVLTGSRQDSIHIDRIVPIYPVTEGVSPKFLRGLIHKVLGAASVCDPLPRKIAESEKLMPLGEALKKIHFPGTFPEKEKARTRLAFQELFMIQTVLAAARKRRRVPRAHRYEIKKDLLTPFRERLGF